jgi:hypothetical protein
MSLGGPSLLTSVEAQSDRNRVVIGGWLDERGNFRSLPSVGRDGNFPAPLPIAPSEARP